MQLFIDMFVKKSVFLKKKKKSYYICLKIVPTVPTKNYFKRLLYNHIIFQHVSVAATNTIIREIHFL